MDKKFKTLLLSAVFGVLALLSKTWFDGVNANAAELNKLKESDKEIRAQIQGKNDLFEERFGNLFKKLDIFDSKLERILSTLDKNTSDKKYR